MKTGWSRLRENSVRTEFQYDGTGILSSITTDGQTRHLITDPSGLGSIVGEYDQDGNLIRRHDHAYGLLRQSTPTGDEYFTYNDIGNTSEITDASGVLTDQVVFEPFGEAILRDGSSETASWYSGETGALSLPGGLQYMRSRFYSPELGQFINEDPIRIEGVNNRTYAENSPLQYSDPTGLTSYSASERLWDGLSALTGLVGSTIQVGIGIGLSRRDWDP